MIQVDSQAEEICAVASNPIDHEGSWLQSVIGLLGVATQQLQSDKEAAQSAIEQAASLLQGQMRAHLRQGSRASGGLQAWQVRKVREYVDGHIARRLLVSDLSAVVQLSAGYFARSFKRSLGLSPHAFVLQRRLELAARLMLESTESLADIAQRCGFSDQAHLSKLFGRSMGESPAAWRRTRFRVSRGLRHEQRKMMQHLTASRNDQALPSVEFASQSDSRVRCLVR
jgi:AraC family transcriptional regulator